MSNLFSEKSQSSAVISECGGYRYRLERQCAGDGATAIIMVNPSTADGEQDDATIRRLRGFGDRHKWGRLVVGNLFAYRATDVYELADVADPIGPDNDSHLADLFSTVDRVIVAWGTLGKQPAKHHDRHMRIREMVAASGHTPMMIGPATKCGQPKHPLMLAYAAEIVPWGGPHG